MKVWVNCIVNNEENFVWFAITSVVDYVDKVLVWDTGSTDNTPKIIDEIVKIYGNKIEFKKVGKVTATEFPKLRQEMLEKSNCDWLIILDGDEVWPKESIKLLIETIKSKKNLDGIVVPMYMLLGDIYHHQEEIAGEYELLGKKGHFNLRAINRNIPGLHVDYPYGKESFLDGENNLIQNRKNIVFIDAPYFHATHLKRSNTKRQYDKYKYEFGNKFHEDVKLPEVFLKPYPDIIPRLQVAPDMKFIVFASVLTPLRKLKRRLQKRSKG